MVSIPQQNVLGEVRIQRTATSMVPDLEDRPYLERLKELIKIKRLKIKRHDSLDIINYNHGMWKHTSLDLCHESVFVSVFFLSFGQGVRMVMVVLYAYRKSCCLELIIFNVSDNHCVPKMLCLECCVVGL